MKSSIRLTIASTSAWLASALANTFLASADNAFASFAVSASSLADSLMINSSNWWIAPSNLALLTLASVLLAPLFAPFPSFPWFCETITSTGTLISSTLPSANLTVTLAITVPNADVVGFSTLTISTPLGKFSFDKTSLSVKDSPCLTVTEPFTNNFDKSYSSCSRITAEIR